MATSAEYGLGEFAYPRGWFMVGASEEAATTPLAVRYFGQDMVLYRGQSGRVFLVEAYCPHMGTHLARNTSSYVVKDGEHVEGDSIRCPYHGWRFGPDGKCNDIPYSPAPIPKAACLKSWQVIERAGCIWMWHDSEGGAPNYDLPAFANYENPAWVKWKIDQLGELACHPQEIVDNMTDKGHLGPVHGSTDMVLFENEFADHVVRQILSAGHKTLTTGSEAMTNDTWYTGPGILQSTMEGEMPSLILIAHTPVDDGVVKVWHALLVRSQHEVATEEDVTIARAYQQSSLEAFSQDFEIWANKRACINPLMVKGDGPFDKLRVWYKQFYNPRARAGEFHARVNGRYETRGTANAPWDAAA
jgi:3-ketosteroid 9alpha-monooxygenase subunit A